MLKGTFGQLLECWLLVFSIMLLVLLRQEALLLGHGGELCVFFLAFFLSLFEQRPRKEPERDARQQGHGANHDEAQPPGPHPTGVLVVDSDGV